MGFSVKARNINEFDDKFKRKTIKMMDTYFMTSRFAKYVEHIMPGFTEEYGANSKIDIEWWTSHKLFQEIFPEAKMSGVYMDKKGNWKMVMNIDFAANVDRDSEWIEMRHFYATVVFKFKLTTDASD